MLTFISAYFSRRKEFYKQMTKRSYWRTFATVTLSVLLIVILASMGLFWFLGQIFYGVSFGLFTSTLIFTIFSGIINYVMIFVVDTFSINMMVTMLLVVSQVWPPMEISTGGKGILVCLELRLHVQAGNLI